MNWASYLNLFNYYQHEIVFQVLQKCSTGWDCWVVSGLPRKKVPQQTVVLNLSIAL